MHVYSLGYMSHDEHQPRFFAFLSLFTFAMLMLVTSDNLLQMFFGWEGVGLMSYLLIGFWYTRESANAAAIKAFVVNRVGDFGFALGIFGCFYVFQSVEFDTIFAAAGTQSGKTIHFLSWEFDTLTTLCLLLFMGAMGKSAQFLLHTWLPDAMEGPTPVSALIHAATMVTAGVFLVARLRRSMSLLPTPRKLWSSLAPLPPSSLQPWALCKTTSSVSSPIQPARSWVTCSWPWGWAPMASPYSISSPTPSSRRCCSWGRAPSSTPCPANRICARWVALRPTSARPGYLMMIGNLALTGFPLTAGYYSKDAIIESAFAGHSLFAFTLLVIAAFCTSFYSWRLAFMTFNGKSRADAHTLEHVHESPNVMLVPLYVLAAGALLAGIIFAPYFIGHEEALFWGSAIYRAPGNEIIHHIHDVPFWVKAAPFVVMVLGFLLAFLFYIRDTSLPKKLAALNSAALPIPAQQMVLRRTLLADIHPSRHVAWPLPVEKGRWLRH